jgi:hypothetical protein
MEVGDSVESPLPPPPAPPSPHPGSTRTAPSPRRTSPCPSRPPGTVRDPPTFVGENRRHLARTVPGQRSHVARRAVLRPVSNPRRANPAGHGGRVHRTVRAAVHRPRQPGPRAAARRLAAGPRHLPQHRSPDRVALGDLDRRPAASTKARAARAVACSAPRTARRSPARLGPGTAPPHRSNANDNSRPGAEGRFG